MEAIIERCCGIDVHKKNIVVGLAVGLDHAMGTQGSIRMLAILFYIGTEGISILENAVDLNVPIPEKLKNMLLKMQENDEIKEA